MKEQKFLDIITNNIGKGYIGDDCAFLKELGIVVTQDNFIENVHFKKEWYTPYQLGYKSMAINISDIFASGAQPAYVSIALSLPSNIDEDFIDKFYKGAKSCLYGAKIIGGDLTGSDHICISITAIGKTSGRKISSRSHAKSGYVIISRNKFGLSAQGLQELLNGGNDQDLIKAHLEPILDEEFSKYISEHIDSDYAMMDTSDGLADALFKIAENSKVSINTKNINGMFGAEDYNLIAAVPTDFINELPFKVDIIGDVVEKANYILKINDVKYYDYDELKLYNHFGG